MFSYQIYKTMNNLTKHMEHDNDKHDVFTKQQFKLRDLLEETLVIILEQKLIKIKSIELYTNGNNTATVALNDTFYVFIIWNSDDEHFEFAGLKGVIVTSVRLAMILLSPKIVNGIYEERDEPKKTKKRKKEK